MLSLIASALALAPPRPGDVIELATHAAPWELAKVTEVCGQRITVRLQDGSTVFRYVGCDGWRWPLFAERSR